MPNSAPTDSGLLSVVLPAFNEEEMAPRAADVISALLEQAQIPHELIFVDDGSRDRTWARIQEKSRALPQVRGVRFSRNFGKEAAILAGLSAAEGACAAVMDCDMQHPPETLPEMYAKWQEGYEIIEGVKADRGREKPEHRISAGIFYRIMSRATGIDMSRSSDFRLLDRKAVRAILSLPERNMFFRALSSWIGYRTATVEFSVHERFRGTTKWSTFRLIKYALSNIMSFTSAPMQLVTGLGLFTLVTAVVICIQTLVKYASGTAVEGFTTVIILLLFIGSIIMICMGITGCYIAKIYEEVKGRPRYIISDTAGRERNGEDR